MAALSFSLRPRKRESILVPCLREKGKACSPQTFKGLSDAQKKSVLGAFQNKELPKSGIIPVYSEDAPVFLLLLGEKVELKKRDAREKGMSLKSYAQEYSMEEVFIFPGSLIGDLYDSFQEGVVIGLYEFNDFKGEKDRDERKKKGEKKLAEVTFSGKENRERLRYLKALEESLKVTKDIVNIPSSITTPSYLENFCRSLIKKLPKTTIRVLGEMELKKLECGGILNVAKASDEAPRLILLEWKGGPAGGSPVALIGKGVTYDTGGLNIKPGKSMRFMKQDLAGAATAIGVFMLLVAMNIRKNVIAVLPVVENLISRDAYRPDDILTMHNGKTVEITNTDAEGRLILADALSYAEKELSPGAMIDIATLTGACIYAVGEDLTAVLGNNKDLVRAIQKAAETTDEPVWELPLHEKYRKNLDSKIADILNGSGKIKAGTIEGGLFLQYFVTDKTPWCHFDIASVAFDESSEMATGRNVRLLYEFVKDYTPASRGERKTSRKK